MKFNWGHGLAIGMVLFMGYILYFVVWSFDVDHQLETPDYYGKELKHQEQIDKSANYSELDTGLLILISESDIQFKFPGTEKPSGQIQFYRPSDIDKDVIVEIKTNEEQTQTVEKGQLSKGRYVVKIDWEAENQTYYFEKNIVL